MPMKYTGRGYCRAAELLGEVRTDPATLHNLREPVQNENVESQLCKAPLSIYQNVKLFFFLSASLSSDLRCFFICYLSFSK